MRLLTRLPLTPLLLMRAMLLLPLTPLLLMRTPLLLMRALLPTLPPKRQRNRLLRRSKRLLYGLNGRADGAETPRLPPAVLFPGS